MRYGWGISEKVPQVGRMARLRQYRGQCGAKVIKFGMGPGYALKGRLLASHLEDLTWDQPEGATVQIFEDGHLMAEGTPAQILADAEVLRRLSEG